MLDGFRRLAVAFAVAILLIPCTRLLAETGSDTSSQNKTAQKSASDCEHLDASTKGGAGAVAITSQARSDAQDIFESRCVACHGEEGRGDGPAAANLNPGPRDFHNLKWQKSVNNATLTRAIIFGGKSVGLSAEMAPNPDLENEPAVVAALVERIRGWCK